MFNRPPTRVPPSALRAWIASRLDANATEDDIDERAHEAEDAGLGSAAVEAARLMVRARRGLPERARKPRQQGGQGQGNGQGNGGGRP